MKSRLTFAAVFLVTSALALAKGTLAKNVSAEDQAKLAREFLATVTTTGEA